MLKVAYIYAKTLEMFLNVVIKTYIKYRGKMNKNGKIETTRGK